MIRYAEPLEVRARRGALIHEVYDLLWISGGWWTADRIADRLGRSRETVRATVGRNLDYFERREVPTRWAASEVEWRARRG